MLKFLLSALFVTGVLLNAPNLASGQRKDLSGNTATESNEKDMPVHVVKLDFFQFIHGDFPIYYERRMTNHLTLIGGLGVTYRDYWYHLWVNGIDINTDLGKLEETKPGYSARFGARFYPAATPNTPDGFYLSAMLLHKRYNWVQRYTVDNTSVLRNEYRLVTDLQFLLGYQYISPTGIALDVYGGLGTRFHDAHRYRLTYDSNNSGYDLELARKPNIRPALLFGLQLGYAF